MMILAGILRRTGFFQWLAIRSVKVAGGEPYRLLLVLSVVCARPVGVPRQRHDRGPHRAGDALHRVRPAGLAAAVPHQPRSWPANIGGTATLIGDPPNILIGSAAGLGFDDFLINMAPAAVLVFVVFLLMTRWFFGRDLAVHADVRDAVLALDEREVLTDVRLLRGQPRRHRR